MGLLAGVESKANRMRAWEADDPRRKRRVYAAAYTVSFIVAAFVVLFVYPSNGRSIVWDVDGLEQFYPFFVYEGQWLREIAGNLFSGQGLQIPLFAYNLGYGMDIPSTLDVFFDPLNLLSGLCPERYSEYLFQFLIVFRLYLAGWAFSLFAFKFNTGRFATLLGALLYALGGTALAVAFWPASAWPMVLFPLVLVGVERMLAGKGPAAFVASVAAFFIVSYYFSYMACLLLVAYCAVRVVQTGKGRRVKTFALWTAKFAGCVVIALMIAGFSLMPSIVGLLGVDRFVEARVDVPALYTIGYYLRTVAGFAGTANVGSDCYIGFGGMALLACVLLFMRRGGHRTLKAAFIVMTVMLLLPAVGSLMNGLNYATNRWVWAYALLVSFIVAKMLPDLLSLGKRDVKVLGIACLAYAAVCMAFAQTRNEATLAALAVLAVCLFAVSQTDWSAKARSAGIAVCLVTGLAVNAFYFVSPDEGGVGKRSVPIASLYSKLVDESPNRVVSEVDDDGLWRYDAPSSVWSRTRNDSLVLGLMGMDFYNSSYNSYVDAYHTELALTGTEVNFSYKSLEGRSILDILSGVKYYLMPQGKGDLPVFNYADPNRVAATGTADGTAYNVYEGSNVLPLAYVYDSAVSRSAYDALSPVQKQEALLQGVVLQDSALPQTQLDLESRALPVSVAPGAGASVEGDTVTVTQRNATVTLSFEGLPASETYVYLKGVDFTPLPPSQQVSKRAYDGLPWYSKAKLFKRDMEWSAPREYSITALSPASPVGLRVLNSTKDNHMYGGKTDWLVELGYTDEAQSTATLQFSEPGVYRFSELSAACQPMAKVDAHVDALKATPVNNLTFGTNQITASVDFDSAKVLYFSVPYSKGWSALVDGQPVQIQRANTAFMALELGPGHHEVKLTYMTPGLLEGFALTGAGLVAFAGVLLAARVRKRAKAAVRAGGASVHSNREGA